MIKYWRGHPPTHVLVAAFLGVKAEGPGEKDERRTWENESLESMLSRWGAEGAQIKRGTAPGFKKANG